MEQKYGDFRYRKKRKRPARTMQSVRRGMYSGRMVAARPRRRYAVTAVSATRRLQKLSSKLPMYMPVLPKAHFCQFVTSFGYAWSGATSGQKYLYCNSIYQPNGNFGGTEQPVGFDQWSAFFARYVVYSGVVEVIFNSQDYEGADASKPYIDNSVKICLWLSAQTTSLASIADASSQPGAQLIHVPNNVGRKVRVPFNCARVAGHNIDPDTDGALVTANPSELIYLHVWVTSTPSNYNMDSVWRIVQNTHLYDGKEIAQSVR